MKRIKDDSQQSFQEYLQRIPPTYFPFLTDFVKRILSGKLVESPDPLFYIGRKDRVPKRSHQE